MRKDRDHRRGHGSNALAGESLCWSKGQTFVAGTVTFAQPSRDSVGTDRVARHHVSVTGQEFSPARCVAGGVGYGGWGAPVQLPQQHGGLGLLRHHRQQYRRRKPCAQFAGVVADPSVLRTASGSSYLSCYGSYYSPTHSRRLQNMSKTSGPLSSLIAPYGLP